MRYVRDANRAENEALLGLRQEVAGEDTCEGMQIITFLARKGDTAGDPRAMHTCGHFS
jgi:hypothetical protein